MKDYYRRYASQSDKEDADNDQSRSRQEKEYRNSGGDRVRVCRDDRGDDGSQRPLTLPSALPLARSASATMAPDDKAKPKFDPSGLLAAATNTVKNADVTSTLLN